jgi:hypothetical protein
VLTSPILVTAGWFRTFVLQVPFGDVYLHNPGRLRYVAVIALPVLAAAGLQGLVERPLSRRGAIAWVGGTALLFVVWPLLAGGHPVRFVMVAVVVVAAGPLLYGFATRRWRWASAPAIAGVVVLELLASAVYAQAYEGGTIFTGLETGDHPNLAPQVLRYPVLDETAYLHVTPIVEHLRREPGRYATWAPPAAYFEKGYLWMKSPADWPALAPSRGTLFGVPDALGYNPVQLPRYWRYIRATNELSVFYNASVLNEPSVQDVRLLGLRYLIVPSGLTSPLPGRIVVRADRYALWELYDVQRLATMTGEVVMVDDVAEAMRTVTTPGFDPSRQVVLERASGLFIPDRGPSFATATVTSSSATEVRIGLEPSEGGVLTTRNAYDAGWRAEVDGVDARTLPVDGFLQGVVVGAPGAEEVVLTYHDDAVMFGLALGAAVWAILLAAPLVALALERRSAGRRTMRPRRRPPAAGAPPR